MLNVDIYVLRPVFSLEKAGYEMAPETPCQSRKGLLREQTSGSLLPWNFLPRNFDSLTIY